MRSKPHYGLPTVSPANCEPLLGLGVNSPFHFLLKAFPKFYKGGLRWIGKKEQISCIPVRLIGCGMQVLLWK